MSLSSKEIFHVLGILKKEVTGAVVRKVLSPISRDRIVLLLRAKGENHFLKIVTSHGETLIARTNKKLPLQKTPHPFVMLLRKEISGSLLKNITQIQDDRIVNFEFNKQNKKNKLIAELTSRHSNIFLLDEKDIITGSYYPNKSKKRDLVPGKPYVPIKKRKNASGEKSRFDKSDIEQQINDHYDGLRQNSERDKKINNALGLIKKRENKLTRLKKNLEKDFNNTQIAEELEKHAHILKANLNRIKPRQEEVKVSDFEGNNLTIKLVPSISSVENMEKMFKKSKKLRVAQPIIKKRLKDTVKNIKIIKKMALLIDSHDPEQEKNGLKQFEKEFKIAFGVKPSTKQKPRLPFFEYTIQKGHKARVGRSAKDNDLLLSRFSRPQDLWLHARGYSGSHVVVPMEKKETLDKEVLLDAAHLASHFSSAKNETEVEVLYTHKRYVQKPKGAAPGLVKLIKEKTFMLKVSQKRLNEIFNNEK